MIRHKIRSEIIATINNHKQFEISDFDIELKNETSLSIKYTYDDKYYFNVTFPKDVTRAVKENRLTHGDEVFEQYNFKGSVSPGRVAVIEKLEFEGETTIYNKLRTWLDCLWEELMAIPVNRRQDEFDATLREMKTKFKDIPDEYFSREEGEELKRKLDELERRFQAQFDNDSLDKEVLQKKHEELHQEFTVLKETLYSLKKPGWYKSLGVRILTWFMKEENRKFLKDAKDSIVPLLPDGVKHLIP